MRLPVKWGDCVIIALVLALALAVALPFYLRPSDRLTCEIVQDGAVTQTIALTDTVNETVTIEGAVTNHIEVTGEGVRFTESTCPDQVCVRQGAIRTTAAPIVCLPHKLVIKFVGDQEIDGLIG